MVSLEDWEPKNTDFSRKIKTPGWRWYFMGKRVLKNFQLCFYILFIKLSFHSFHKLNAENTHNMMVKFYSTLTSKSVVTSLSTCIMGVPPWAVRCKGSWRPSTSCRYSSILGSWIRWRLMLNSLCKYCLWYNGTRCGIRIPRSRFKSSLDVDLGKVNFTITLAASS